MENFQGKVGFIWSVADLLRGDFKQSEYGRVILPLTVLRRLDCVLEPTKKKVLAKAKDLPKKADEAMQDLMLAKASGHSFYNLSQFTFASLLGDPEHIAANLRNYIAGFSANAREIFIDKFKFDDQIARLDDANLLYMVLSKFTEIITVLNDKFGTDFTPEDQLLFDQVVGDLTSDQELADQARNNSLEQFKYAFDPKAMSAFITRMERNEGISSQLMSNEELRAVAMQWMMCKVFEHFQGAAG